MVSCNHCKNAVLHGYTIHMQILLLIHIFLFLSCNSNDLLTHFLMCWNTSPLMHYHRNILLYSYFVELQYSTNFFEEYWLPWSLCNIILFLIFLTFLKAFSNAFIANSLVISLAVILDTTLLSYKSKILQLYLKLPSVNFKYVKSVHQILLGSST